MNYSLTKISSNSKTGAIPVTTSNRATCPDACPLKRNGCYAEDYYTQMHWNRVTSGGRGTDWHTFLMAVKSLPKRALWRHNVAGDLRGSNNRIDTQALKELTQANKGKNGFTYTHYPLDNPVNITAVMQANNAGFTVNGSANSLEQADNYKALGIPTVVILPEDASKVSYTLAGNKIVVCPAQNSDKVTCSSCGLCQLAKRDYIIGFRVHGNGKKKAKLAIGLTS
jgi:hypothetical protein